MSRMQVYGFRVALAALALIPGWATTLVPPQCVGLNNGPCPGFVEGFTGSPGTFLTGATANVVSVSFTGLLSTAVFLNPNGTTLDFYYQFKNNPASAAAVGAVSPTLFSGFTTDIGARKDGLGSFGTGLTAVSFLSSPHDVSYVQVPTAGQVYFAFGILVDDLLAGQTSSTLVVKTNATAYTYGRTLVSNTDGHTLGGTFEPASPAAPEPGTILFSIAGLITIYTRRRRNWNQLHRRAFGKP